MAIRVTAVCDRCDIGSGDYGWTSIVELKRDLKKAGWVFGKSPISGPYVICDDCINGMHR